MTEEVDEEELDPVEEAEKAKAWIAGQHQRPIKFYPEIAANHISKSEENES